MTGLEAFHFLRPGWLLLLLPALLVAGSIVLRQDPMRGWRRVIAPELLPHLAIRREQRRSRIRPVMVLASAWAFAIVALAGRASLQIKASRISHIPSSRPLRKPLVCRARILR